MASTFASVYVSYRAMVAAQAGTSVVGNNISNMNTEGYTRQRVDLASQTLSGYKSKFDTSLIHTGNGVAATGTSQIRDSFLDARYRAEHANQGRYDAISSALKDVENILDEISTKGLQSEFDNFINQLQNLSQYPTSKDIGLVVRTSAQQLTQMLNIYSTQLNQVRSQQLFDLSNVTVNTEFNSIVDGIANLNGEIREEYLYGNTPNELLDQRNILIDKLSQMANIKVTVTADEVANGLFLEHLSISMFDDKTGTSIGLVDHKDANHLKVEDDGDKVKISMETSFENPNTPPGFDYSDITDYFQTGSISGYLDILNGKGDYADTSAGENNFRGVPYYKDMLNTFAKNFASQYNEINSIQKIDEHNNTTTLEEKPLFAASDGSATITAGNIAISDKWMDDPLFITTTKDPSQDDGLSKQPGGTDNVLRMISAVSNDVTFLQDPDQASSAVKFTGTFNEYLVSIGGTLSLDVESNKNYLETSNTLLSSLYDSRESVSGVSLDEEATHLMTFQSAYNAAARYFTALDEMLDKLINSTGLVGR